MDRVDVARLRERLGSGDPPVLVDVRTAMEFAGGHVPEAENIPLHAVHERMGELRDRGPIHLICRSGARSAQAAGLLEAAGVEAVNVEGGTSAWVGAGFGVKVHRSWRMFLLPAAAALTLGLAPFSPEPHLLGKLRWVATGASGMGAMDWFDLALHGAPWLWLGLTGLRYLRTPAD